MMKKYIPLFIGCIFPVLLLLTGCHGGLPGEKEPVSTLLSYDAATVYSETMLPMPEDMADNFGLPADIPSEDLRSFAASEDGVYAVYHTAGGTNAVAAYHWDGTLAGTFPIPDTDLMTIIAIYPTEDGNLLALANVRESADSFFEDSALLLLDRNNTILHRYDFAEEVYRPAFAVSEECIAMVSAETLYLFDHTLQLQSRVSLSMPFSPLYTSPIGWMDADTLYYAGDDQLLYTLDIRTGYLYPLHPETILRSVTWQHYSTDERYLLWEVNSDGIYGIPHPGSGSEEPVMLCSWAASGFPRSSILVRHIHDAGNILCTSTNNINSQQVYVLLHPHEADPAAPVKKTVTIAAFQDQNLAFLQKLIGLFNAQSTEYTVELHQYENPMYPNKIDEVSEELFRTLSEGTVPDLLLMNGYGEAIYRNLEKQGYLADLSALTEGMTASAKNAARYKGTFTRIPLVIRYSTLLSGTSDAPLTLESFLAAGETLQPGQALFSSPVSADLTVVIQSLFIDTAAGTCSFDTPEFLSYLEILQNLDSLTDTSLGTPSVIQVDGNLTYRMTNADLPHTLARGDLRYLHMPLWSVSSWLLTKLSYTDTEPTVCGYPGIRAIPSIDCSFVQFREGANPDGAAAFLEYILSDTVQTSAAVTNFSFPVTSSALAEILKPEWYTVTCTNRPMMDPAGENTYSGTVMHVDAVSYEKPRDPAFPETRLIPYTDTDRDMLRSLLESEDNGTVPDPTVETILQEELSVYLSGARSAKDTAAILQNRVSIYLAE